MHNTLVIELLAARKASSLRQGDIAHLLGVKQSKISAYETGKQVPSQEHLLMLALIYGGPFERFQEEQLRRARRIILDNLKTLPLEVRITADTYHRPLTIEHLHDRLSAEADDHELAA